MLKNIHNQIFYVAGIIYFLTAFFSVGYYHPDEHYQIIEFAQLLSGENTPYDMAWEYHSRIRPVFQPFIFYLVSKGIRMFFEIDPYDMMRLMRLSTAFLSLIIIRQFIRAVDFMIQDNYKNIFVFASYLLWFLPFINVRFSSETYSGLMILLAISFYYKSYGNKYYYMGIFFGMSFCFRFQSAILIVCFILWLLIIEKSAVRNLLKLISTMAFILMLGTILDSWFYKEIVLTPLNYFYTNIYENVASRFGVSPWYGYLRYIIDFASEPIAFIIFCSLTILLILGRKTFVFWLVFPFLIIHMFIPHKELRFIFPILNFIPLMIIIAIQSINFLFYHKTIKYITYTLLLFILVQNILLVLVNSFLPGDRGENAILEYLQKNSERKQIKLWSIGYCNPYKPIGSLVQPFYNNPNVKQDYLTNKNLNQVDTNLINYFILNNYDRNKYRYLIKHFHLELIKESPEEVPRNLKSKLLPTYNSSYLMLFRLKHH